MPTLPRSSTVSMNGANFVGMLKSSKVRYNSHPLILQQEKRKTKDKDKLTKHNELLIYNSAAAPS